MEITITLSTKQAQLFSRWASLGRTIDTATRVCEDIITLSGIDAVLIERAEIAESELKQLKQPLDALFMDVRNQIWAKRVMFYDMPDGPKIYCRNCNVIAGKEPMKVIPSGYRHGEPYSCDNCSNYGVLLL